MELVEGLYSELTRLEIVTVEEFKVIQSNQIQLLFVLSGYIEIIKNDEILLLEVGQIEIINRGDNIRVISSSNNKVLVIGLDIQLQNKRNMKFILPRPLSKVYLPEVYEKITKCIINIFFEIENKEIGTDYLVEGYTKQLIGFLIRHITIEEVDESILNEEISERTLNVIAYMNEHYHQKLSLDNLAAKFYMSKFHLSHLFKKELGMTIGSYIKEIRLFQSVKLLESTRKTIEDITSETGFPNTRSFQTAFKEKFGLSPLIFRENRVNKKVLSNSISDDPEILSLISYYLDGRNENEILSIREKINTNQVQSTFMNQTLLLKTNSTRLLQLSEDLLRDFGQCYVSVDYIVRYIEVRENQLDFSHLDRRISSIIKAGMIPYIHLQAVDYDEWMIKDVKVEFQEMIHLLKLHLIITYPSLSNWAIEFRCFYEAQEKSRVSTQLVDVIGEFKDLIKLLIFLPNMLEDSIPINSVDEGEVYYIDNLTRVVRVSYEEIVEHLHKDTYIDNLKEMRYLEVQQFILDRMVDFEKDTHLQDYNELARLNTTITTILKMNDFNVSLLTPVSLDSSNLFLYFVDELSEKISLYSSEGLRRLSWFSYVSINRLYKDIVFQNEYCIITKSSEHFCILLNYPEENIFEITRNKDKLKQTSLLKQVKSPSVELIFELCGLNGEYKIITEELSTKIIDERKNLQSIKQSKYMSKEDIEYYNAHNRPQRSVKFVSIEDKYMLKVELPILGIQMIELQKIG